MDLAFRTTTRARRPTALALLARVALALGALASLDARVAAQPRPPQLPELLRRLDDLYRSSSSVGVASLTVVTPRQTRSLRMRIWTRGEDKALVVLESPARERGTATLRIGDNLWNWLPRISRTIRVPPSMMLGSWMGSDFTNDDLVHESSYRSDFSSRITGRSASPAGWLLRLDARQGVVGRWQRIDMVVDDAGALPIEARYFDRRGRLARTMRFEDVRTMDGRRIPSRMVLTPVDPPGHRTELRYEQMDFDADVPDSTFSLSRLERNR